MISCKRAFLLNLAIVSTIGIGNAFSAERMDTRFGSLTVVDNRGTQEVLFNGKPVGLKEYLVSLSKKFSIGEGDVILAKLSSGGTACPATYSFVTVTASGAKASKEFGSCSDIPQVTQSGSKITVKFPKFRDAPAQTIEYENGLKKKNGKSL